MTNLIVTIISIALAAIAILMVSFIANDVMINGTNQSRMNMFLEENRQIYAAATQYITENGLSSFSGVTFTQLYQGKYLGSTVPIMGVAVKSSGTADATCQGTTSPGVVDGYEALYTRSMCQINGVNVVNNYFRMNTPFNNNCLLQNNTFTNASAAAHPIVKMCLQINAKANLPSGLTYAASGLPYPPDGANANCDGGGNTRYFNGTNKFGYCYIYNGDRIVFTFAN